MLYDPKWEKKTKAEPRDLGNLIAWLETMPAGKTYPFGNCQGGCMYSQYLVALGYDNGIGWNCNSQKMWSDLHREPFYSIANTTPWTFGAALARSREALSSA